MILWSALACSGRNDLFVETGDSGADAGQLDVTFEPTAVNQAPRLVVTTAFDATVLVTWFDGDGVRTVSTPTPGRETRIQLLGLRSGTPYEFEVTAFGGQGAAQTHATYTTDPLPAGFPEIDSPVPGPVDGADTLLAVRSARSDTDPVGVDRLAVVRGDGEVVWWFDPGDVVHDVQVVEDGIVAFVGVADPRVVHWGWDGAERRRFDRSGAGTRVATVADGPLHAVGERIDDDRWLTVQRVSTVVTDVPTTYEQTETGTRTVADEVALVFTGDGTVTSEVRASSFWPVGRLGWGSLDPTPEGADTWADARALRWDGGDLLWTLTNQDAVTLLDVATGDLRWFLGPDHDLPPATAGRQLRGTDGPLSLPWHPDGASFGPDRGDGRRTLLVFDTGAYGAAPPTPPIARPESRVLGYLVNEETRRATPWFTVRAPGGVPLYSPTGEVSASPDGTILSVWGAVAGDRHTSGHVVMIDPDTGAPVRHQVVSAADADWAIRAGESLPPLDSFVSWEIGAEGATTTP